MKEQVYTFFVGALKCHTIYSSYFTIAPRYIFSGVDEALYKDQLSSSLENGKIHIPVSVLLVEYGERKILIDTGLNIKEGDQASEIQENLKSLNIKLSDVTDIIITHGHNDHIGGIFDTDGEIVFKNARYWVATAEQNFWKTKEVLKALGYLKITPQLYEKLKERTTSIDAKKEIFPGIFMQPAYGHTPGHMTVRITSSDESLVHIGDLAVHPLHITYPQWHVKPDVDRDSMEQSRAKFFAEITENGEMVFANHFAFPCLGYIQGNDVGEFMWAEVKKI